MFRPLQGAHTYYTRTHCVVFWSRSKNHLVMQTQAVINSNSNYSSFI